MNNQPINIRTKLSRLFGGANPLVLIAVVILVFFLGYISSGDKSNTDGHDHDSSQQTQAEQPTVWTCSMHPNIKLPEKGKCPICFMDLIPLETDNDDYSLNENQLRLSESARQLARIQSQPVLKMKAVSEIELTGKIAYDESALFYVTARIPGRLDKLYADITGLSVKEGEPLFDIYSPELIASFEELNQAKITLSSIDNSSQTILKNSARATYEAAYEKLILYGITEKQINEVELNSIPRHLTINSPITGVILNKHASEGAYVKTGNKVYTIADLSNLWVNFEAYESDLPWLAIGQTVLFTSTSFPGLEYEANISFIDPVVDSQKRTIRVRADVTNKQGKLKPDMFVSGLIHSNMSGSNGKINSEALVIPASSALLTGKRAVVYIETELEGEPIFEGRVVELGPRSGDYYVVISGVHEGEMVVVNGAFKLDSELQIRAKPSMMSPDGGAAPALHNHDQSESDMESMAETNSDLKDISMAAVSSLSPVYQAYFKIQTSLAEDKASEAIDSYTKLIKAVKDVDMSLFEGDSHMEWMAFHKNLSKTVDGIDDIEELRQFFEHTSTNIINLHNRFGHSEDKNFYLTFCPMAFDNRGAYWVQDDTIINNSYFGEKMLRCGEVKETWMSKSSEQE